MYLLESIEVAQDELTGWRRDIHSHPELGFEESRTAAIVAEKLRQFGCEVHTGIGRTGVVGCCGPARDRGRSDCGRTWTRCRYTRPMPSSIAPPTRARC